MRDRGRWNIFATSTGEITRVDNGGDCNGVESSSELLGSV
jgi:hypothetical protein